MVFNTGLYTDLPDNSILITANMQSETSSHPSSHQLKSYVAFKSRLKLAARAVLSADAGLLVDFYQHIEHRCNDIKLPVIAGNTSIKQNFRYTVCIVSYIHKQKKYFNLITMIAFFRYTDQW